MQDEAVFPASNKDSRIARKLAPVNPAKSHHVSNFPEIKRLDPSPGFRNRRIETRASAQNRPRHKAIGIETTFALSEPRENRPLFGLHLGHSDRAYPLYRVYEPFFFSFRRHPLENILLSTCFDFVDCVILSFERREKTIGVEAEITLTLD